MENTTNMNRRSFLMGSAAAGASSLLPLEALAHHADNKDTIAFPVVPFMTGNILMGYIASEIGKDLGQRITDDSRKLLSVHMGDKSPKTVYVGTNSQNVVLSDQFAWTPSKKSAEVFKYHASFERSPSTINFIFPGQDSLVLDLNKLSAEERQKVVDRFGNNKPTAQELSAYVSKAFGTTIQKAKEAVQKMGGLDSQRVARYTNMNDLEFMARRVTEDAGKEMYAPLVTQGVKFAAPEKYVGAAAVGPEHRSTSLAGIYPGVAFDRLSIPQGQTVNGLTRRGNFGITPNDPSIGYTADSSLRINEDALAAIVGKDTFAEMIAKTVTERKKVAEGAVNYNAIVRDDRARDLWGKLIPHAEVYDTATGRKTEALDLGKFARGEYKIQAVTLQRVDPNYRG